MRIKVFPLLAITLALLCRFDLARAADDPSTLTKVGDAAPKFTIQTLDGQTLTPESLKGKVVLVNFFATWCGPCVAELPHLQKLHEKLKDKPLVMVSVGREHNADEVKAFAEKNKYTFAFAADPKREAYKLFAEKFIPRNYVLDSSGKIVFQSMGYEEGEFAKMIQTIEKSLEQVQTASK